MKRHEALEALVPFVDDSSVVVTNLGMIIYEWEALSPRPGNFYMWHSLGLASSIGLGCALARPERTVWVMDGDGGLLLNLSTLATLAGAAPPNLRVIVFDNRRYEACGRPDYAHPTATARGADLAAVARGAGIGAVFEAEDRAGFIASLEQMAALSELTLLVAQTEMGFERPVAPLALDALENKYRFIRWMERQAGLRITPRS
jgi:sulfopyruvate decarboxylase subunit beta